MGRERLMRCAASSVSVASSVVPALVVSSGARRVNVPITGVVVPTPTALHLCHGEESQRLVFFHRCTQQRNEAFRLLAVLRALQKICKFTGRFRRACIPANCVESVRYDFVNAARYVHVARNAEARDVVVLVLVYARETSGELVIRGDDRKREKHLQQVRVLDSAVSTLCAIRPVKCSSLLTPNGLSRGQMRNFAVIRCKPSK